MPEPTWASEDGQVQLYLGDCLAVLPTLEAGSVDAVVTDPPYGIGYDPQSEKYGAFTAHDRVAGDDEPFDPMPLLRFKRLIVWGGNCFASKLPDEKVWLVWDKATRNGLRLRIAEVELAWTRGLTRPQAFRHMWSGAYRDSERGEYYHPTQKPVALMEWCIKLISDEGDTILDPYFGSCPTGVACVQTGRRFIGIEIEEKYFNIAVKRIQEAKMQLRMELS